MSTPQIEQEATAAAATTTANTPRWVWAWALPLVVILLLYMARNVLSPFIVARVLAYIFTRVIDAAQERLHWPRGLVVGLFYLVVLGVIGVALYFGAETLYQQTRDLVSGGQDTTERGMRQIIGNTTYEFGGQTFDAHSLAQRINEGVRVYLGNSGDALRLAR